MSKRKDSNKVIWYWSNKDQTNDSTDDWIPFNKEINSKLEYNYSIQSNEVIFEQAGEKYKIDFLTMKQYHIHNNSFKWPVKRETQPDLIKASSKPKHYIDLRKSSLISNDSIQIIENLYNKKVQLNREDSKSLYMFGMSYLKGDQGKPKNIRKAMKLLHKASSLGSQEAQYTLGLRYLTGIGIDRDLNIAFELFRQSALQGHVSAMYSLSICYKNGDGIQRDFQSGMKYLRMSADGGHRRACFHYGMSLMLGIGEEIDFKKGFDYLKASADKGYNEAMYQLFICYSEGKGVKKDLQKAKYYFKLANSEDDHDRRSLNLILDKINSNKV